MLTEMKNKIIREFAISANDTGSCEVQIALLTDRINQISRHLGIAKKDNHSRLGLLKLVSKKKTFLNYLKKTSPASYEMVVAKLKKQKEELLIIK